MWKDPIVAEVREVRAKLSAKFNYDIASIFNELRKQQAKLGDKLVHRKNPTKAQPITPNQTHQVLYPGR